MAKPFEIKPETVTEASQTWTRRGRKMYPVFYARINGVKKRISLKNGLTLIDAGVLPMTNDLKKWIHDYYMGAI